MKNINIDFVQVAESYPPSHHTFIVMRDGRIFTATPCYGIHKPWWVVKTMEGEAPPVLMANDDWWVGEKVT